MILQIENQLSTHDGVRSSSLQGIAGAEYVFLQLAVSTLQGRCNGSGGLQFRSESISGENPYRLPWRRFPVVAVDQSYHTGNCQRSGHADLGYPDGCPQELRLNLRKCPISDHWLEIVVND